MDVENIQRLLPADLGHFYRERKGVIRAGKDSVLTDRDLVKMNPRQGEIEADRFGVAKEMHFVAAARQLGAERRRENPAASD